jgi:hypothetical protein
MSRKKAIAYLLVTVVVLGIMFTRHKSGRGMQRLGEYEAQREVNRWYFFGCEIFAHDRMGVFPQSFMVFPIETGQFPREEFRILGYPIGQQDDQFGLGDANHDRVATMRYILRTKMQSSDPDDRIWFIRMLWTERYPGHRADVESLLDDPDVKVRQAAREWLDYLADPNK